MQYLWIFYFSNLSHHLYVGSSWMVHILSWSLFFLLFLSRCPSPCWTATPECHTSVPDSPATRTSAALLPLLHLFLLPSYSPRRRALCAEGAAKAELGFTLTFCSPPPHLLTHVVIKLHTSVESLISKCPPCHCLWCSSFYTNVFLARTTLPSTLHPARDGLMGTAPGTTLSSSAFP